MTKCQLHKDDSMQEMLFFFIPADLMPLEITKATDQTAKGIS